MKIWICEQWKGENKAPEFQGAFESEHLAIMACATPDYFIFPATLNKELPQHTLKPIGYYPKLETKEQAEERFSQSPPK